MTDISRQPVTAVIGLGSMGMGMAQTLIRAGFETHGCDLRPESLETLIAASGHGAATPGELSVTPDVTFIVVVNAAQTRSVLFGDNGLGARLTPGALVVGCATCDPDDARAIAAELAVLDIDYLDAPISGGSVKAAAGEMTIMASGPSTAFAKARSALDALARHVFEVGTEPGQGSQVKLVNQLLAGVHIAAAAEAMAYGIQGGCDPNVLYEVITQSAGNSWMFENRVPHILAGDYNPHSAVDIFVKDLGIVAATGQATKFPLPMTAQALTMFTQASAMGYGREDDAGVIRVFPGVDLPARAANDEG